MESPQILPFSPCGRRWQREALTDEGSLDIDREAFESALDGNVERPLIRLGFAEPPSPARGEGRAGRGSSRSSGL
jgi:hypothetical protein